MSVPTSAVTERVFAGTGTAASLTIDFQFIDPADLVVSRSITGEPGETVLTRGIDYTVAGGNGGPGTVIPAAAIAVGTSWRVRRETPVGQPATFPSGSYLPAQHEAALDRQALINQEQTREIDRAIKVPRGELPLDIAPRQQLAGKALGVSADGERIEPIEVAAAIDQASAAAAASAALSQAWAEGTAPGGAGTRSSREWAERSQQLGAEQVALAAAAGAEQVSLAAQQVALAAVQAGVATTQAGIATNQASNATSAAEEAELQAFIAAGAANFRGPWDAATAYAMGETVTFGEERYIALRASTGAQPNLSPLDWFEIALRDLVRRPVAVQPVTGELSFVAGLLAASPFAPLYSIDGRLHREFQVALAADTAFAAPVFTASVNADSVAISPPLAINTNYRWRCRDVALINGDNVPSRWMNVQTFSTPIINIVTPTVSVTGAPSSLLARPTISTSAFATTPAGQDTHFATSWTVRRISDNALVWQSLNNQTELTSIRLPTGVLVANTAYRFEAQHIGALLGAGPIGQVDGTTVPVFDTTPMLAVGQSSTPFINIYRQEIDTFTRLTNPAVLPDDPVRAISFNADDSLMAVAQLGNFPIRVYSRNLNTFTGLPLAFAAEAPDCRDVKFSPAGDFMAVAGGDFSPRISVYTVSGQTFTRLPNLPDTPDDFRANAVAWADGASILALASFEAPYLHLWSRSGTTFTKLATPSNAPPDWAFDCDFSDDGAFLAVAHSGSSRFSIYSRSGTTFTSLALPAQRPQGVNNVQFSPNGEFLVVTGAVPGMMIYQRAGNTFTKLPDPAVLPDQAGRIAWSADSEYFAVAAPSAPRLMIYKRSGTTFTKLQDPAVLPSGFMIDRGIAFTNTGFPQ